MPRKRAMKQIKGNKALDISEAELKQIAQKYASIHIDFGTGDGRYVYKNAVKNPETLYIGIDPSQKQLEEYSKKAVKDKVNNALFLLGSIEMFPDTIQGVANSVSVILPWGTLLQAISVPTDAVKKLSNFLKTGGLLEILFGYSQDAEPTEFLRLNLNMLSLDYIRNVITPKFLKEGFQSVNIKELAREELKNFESTWCKKLSFGNERPLFYLKLQK